MAYLNEWFITSFGMQGTELKKGIFMKHLSIIAFTLNFVLIFSTHHTQAQADTQEATEQSQPNTTEQEQETSDAQQKLITSAIDPVITQAINFSNAIGDWFEALFDKKQHMSFNTHVDSLDKIVKSMQTAIIKPLVPEKNRDAIALAAYNLTSILYARASTTYDVLNAHRNNAGFWKISDALKKVDKKFRSEQEKTKLKTAFKDLIAQLIKIDAALCKKITQLEVTVAENSTRTKKKGMWALGWGLRHRLQCT